MVSLSMGKELDMKWKTPIKGAEVTHGFADCSIYDQW